MTLGSRRTVFQTLTSTTSIVVENRSVFASAERTLRIGRTRIGALERVRPDANARLTAVLVLNGAVVARRTLETRALVDRLWFRARFASARVATKLVRVRAVEAWVAVWR